MSGLITMMCRSLVCSTFTEQFKMLDIKEVSMSIPMNERKTIRILLGVIFPGVGHIYLGNKSEQRRGIKIAVIFVIVSFLSRYFQFGPLDLAAIPMVGIWIWQIRDLLKITERGETLETVSQK